MDENIELLNYVYQNSQMGIETIEQLQNIVTDAPMRQHLAAELQEYRNINRRSEDMLAQRGKPDKGIPTMQRMGATMGVKMNTLIDKTPSHIAEMMIQGSTMGVIDATKNLKKYHKAEAPIRDLTRQLLSLEQNNIETLKSFL